MRDQVRTHPIRGAAGERLAERGACDARRFNCAERDHHRALPVAAGRRDGDFNRGAVLPHADAGDAHPVVGLRLRDELLHVAVRDDHQPLARICYRSNAIRVGAREPGGADETRHCAEFVGREKPWQSRGLHRERRFQLEEFAEFGLRRRISGG